MSRAPPCSKTGHVLLRASKTNCVPIPGWLQPGLSINLSMLR